MPPSRSRLHLLLIPLAALIAILPLLRNGPTCGHDFAFHLLSWLEAARQFGHGNLHPHWAYTPAYDAGEPRFVFYPPLSWTIGGLLTLLLTQLPVLPPDRAFALVPTLFTGLALAAAGLSMHALARRYTPPNTALLVAILYLANPYTLFTAYERTAYGELLAAAWIPLLLLAILPPTDPAQPEPAQPAAPHPPTLASPNLLLLALAVALLWLTNAPAAVMGCYTVALLAILRLASLFREVHRLRPLLATAARFTAATLLGLALAAFYILPAAFERRWVEINLANVPGMRIVDNTLFHHTPDPDHNLVVHTVSLIALLLLALTAAALLRAILVDRRQTPASSSLSPAIPLAIVTAAIALLLTPVSAPIWRYAPELNFLQFPWRFLAILAPISALAIALALRSVRIPTSAAIPLSLLLPAALTFAAYPAFRQGCEAPSTPQAQLSVFQSITGSDPTDEYTPNTADNDALKQNNPAWTLLPPTPAMPRPSGEAPTHLSLDLPTSETLVLNLRDFPAWQVTRNGSPISSRVARDDGLLAIDLPAGHSEINLHYRTTPDQIAGDAISAAALCVFLPLAAVSLRRQAPR